MTRPSLDCPHSPPHSNTSFRSCFHPHQHSSTCTHTPLPSSSHCMHPLHALLQALGNETLLFFLSFLPRKDRLSDRATRRTHRGRSRPSTRRTDDGKQLLALHTVVCCRHHHHPCCCSHSVTHTTDPQRGVEGAVVGVARQRAQARPQAAHGRRGCPHQDVLLCLFAHRHTTTTETRASDPFAPSFSDPEPREEPRGAPARRGDSHHVLPPLLHQVCRHHDNTGLREGSTLF